MKIKNIFHKNSIIFRLFFLFIITVVPIVLLGILFLSWSKEQVKNEIKTSAQASIHYMSENFCSDVINFSSQLERLLNDNLFTSFALHSKSYSESQYYSSLLDQYNTIQSYPLHYPIIEDITVYYPSDGLTLTASSGVLANQSTLQNEIIDSIRSNTLLLKEYDSTLFLGNLYPASARYNDSVPLYSFTMELSPEYITDLLDSNSEYYDTVFYNHSTNTAVCASSISTPEKYDTYFKYVSAHIDQTPRELAFSWSDNSNYIIAEYSPVLDSTFIQILPLKEIFFVPNQLSTLLIVYVVLAIIAMLLLLVFSNRLIIPPIKNLLAGYDVLEKGEFNVRVPETKIAVEFALLTNGFNKMASHLQETVDKLFEYETRSQKMELKQLQMQMNPHFLYNTYFILHRLIQQEDLEQASLLSSYLGNYLRYITRSARDYVPLSQEWAHARDYLQIQGIRFSTRISFQIDSLPEKYHDFQIPRLILQPLLENALEHGLKETFENGEISMRFKESETYFEILICDNGKKLSIEDINALNHAIHNVSSPDKEFTALHNIHRRLQLTYGINSGITLLQNKPYGLCVRIMIPTLQETL